MVQANSLSGGFDVRSIEDIIQENQDNITAIIPDMDLTAGNPWDVINKIMCLGIRRQEEAIAGMYNNFFLSSATGLAIDTLGVLPRIVGAFSTVQVQITYSRNDNLQLKGLDVNLENLEGDGDEFTVIDSNDKKWILSNTTTLINGVNNCEFRASEMGEISVAINSIQKSQQIIFGIESINNSNSEIIKGNEQESDFNYRDRLQRTQTSGTFKDLYAAFSKNNNITDLLIKDNPNDVLVNNIQPRALWIIVEGAENQDIAEIIYNSKVAGCQLQGLVEVLYNYQAGVNAPAEVLVCKFDRPILQSVYIKLQIRKLNANVNFTSQETAFKQYIIDNGKLYLGNSCDSGKITKIAFDYLIANSLVNQFSITSCELSINGITYTNILIPATFQYKLKLETSKIVIEYI